MRPAVRNALRRLYHPPKADPSSQNGKPRYASRYVKRYAPFLSSAKGGPVLVKREAPLCAFFAIRQRRTRPRQAGSSAMHSPFNKTLKKVFLANKTIIMEKNYNFWVYIVTN